MAEIDDVKEILRKVPFFPPLTEDGLTKIAEHFKLQKFPVNATVFSEGDPGDFFYIVKSGEVDIFVGKGDAAKVLATLKEGDFFGEMALLTGEPRSASVSAKTEVEVITINKADFDNFLVTDPQIAINLTKVLGRRLSRATHAEPVAKKKEAFIIGIYSVRDRMGTSTLASTLAMALAEIEGRKVVLLDFDLQFGDQALILGGKPERTVFDLSQKKDIDPELLEQHLSKLEGTNLKVLYAPRKIEEAETIDENSVANILSFLKNFCDYVVVDTSSVLTGPTVASLDSCNSVLFLVAADLSILKNANACLEVMQTLQYPKEKIKVVLSSLVFTPLKTTNQQIEEILKRKIDYQLPLDATVGQAMVKGEPILKMNVQSPYCQAVYKLAKDFGGPEPGAVKKEEAKKGGGLFGFGKR